MKNSVVKNLTREKSLNNLAQATNYKWIILILAALTNAVVVAIPSMGLSVLLPEISNELNLSLVQAGLVWGISSLPIIISGLLAGSLGDRFGPKRILTVSCLLVGVAGAMRGLSMDIFSLATTAFLFGCLVPLVIINNLKTAGIWFSSRELGLASGVISMGMALGFFVGAMVSATVFSPWLGGWRNVFILYGVIGAVFSIPWYFTRSAPDTRQTAGGDTISKGMRQSMSHIAHLRNIWLLGLAILGISGSIQGLLGYLPLYLRDLGWPTTNADGAQASFHLASMIGVLPIALWSDKLGSRKKVLIRAGLMAAVGIGLLSFVDGNFIWVAVITAGLVRDGFMAVFMAMVIETKGVGSIYAGTATGFVTIFLGIGNLLAPPFGNRLAAITPSAPFMLWAGLTVFGLLCISLTREQKSTLGIQDSGYVGAEN